jgi:hypothetical protein
MGLPENLRSLFWDCDFDSVDLFEHRRFVIRRILDQGDWQAITWLRKTVGDAAIRDWFLATNGRGLDPPRLRFWGLILDLPEDQVDEWVRKAKESPWDRRVSSMPNPWPYDPKPWKDERT